MNARFTTTLPGEAADAALLARLATGHGLVAHFQPIACLRKGTLHGFEALIRGPERTPFHAPVDLFEAARGCGLAAAMEVAAARVAIRAFMAAGAPGRLAINFSAPTIERLMQRSGAALDFLLQAGLEPRRLIIELTEHERVADVARFRQRIGELRAHGVALALDDFGDGHSSLRLWSELAPDLVKIDQYFIRGLHQDPARFQCVKAMLQLGEVFGTRLVAEGIEDEAELRVVRDLGIALGQGYLLGRPAPHPVAAVPASAAATMQATQLAVYPELVRLPARRSPLAELVVAAPTATSETANNVVIELFTQSPQQHALAVLEGDRPVGIINRRAFMDRYAQPYYRELYGKRPCTAFMNAEPLVLERTVAIDRLVEVLAGPDQRYLADGVVVVDGGRYRGLVTGEALVRAVAEVRLEAARYANPLTFLPGNIPISEHIGRLLAAGATFTACYADLNQFKPFNDQYGYWRGDEMIKLAAACLGQSCEPQRDFLGHVGGDDFVVLYQSEDWRERCEGVIRRFDAAAPQLFDPADRARGGITAEDRQGVPTFFGLTTISVGAVPVARGAFRHAEDVASAAAAAKREAKQQRLGLFVAG